LSKSARLLAGSVPMWCRRSLHPATTPDEPICASGASLKNSAVQIHRGRLWHCVAQILDLGKLQN
jgi:hypothetical protein